MSSLLPRIALAAALAALLAACARGEDEAAAEEAVPPVVGARTAVVTARPFTETVSAIGTVEARAGHVASLGAPAQGRVTRVLVAVGQRVSAGQPLVELDPATFAAAAQSAEAAVAAAERSAERTRRLVEEGIAPRKDAEQAAAELARARADLVGAQREARLATLRTPISGVVTRLSATLGATVDPAQPLVEVVDPSALDVVLNATPADAGHIRPGAPTALTAGESAAGEPLGAGTVVDVGAAIDSATRAVAVRVRVPASRRPLRVGETVSGRIAVATRPSAVVVPAEALVPEGDGYKVFVVDAHDVAHAQLVTIGARADSLVEIVKGLAAGARVVTYGAYGVTDSARVVPPEQAGRAIEPAKAGGEKGDAKGDAKVAPAKKGAP
jgi:cobalt-zinc-cadmium efflux system membrane fusion protein